MAFEASVQAKAVELIKLAVEMTTAAGSGHPTSAASLAHLVTVLMYGHMRHDPAKPDHPAADRLVLSEGHACPIVYAAAADLGIAIGRESIGHIQYLIVRVDVNGNGVGGNTSTVIGHGNFIQRGVNRKCQSIGAGEAA